MNGLRNSLSNLACVTVFTVFCSAQSGHAFDWSMFIDPDDHHFDGSALLAKGGFIPMPVIITEPAVEGGFGIVGQFIDSSLGPGGEGSRTMVGLAFTGNDSKAGGILRTGQFYDGRARYQLAFGGADITLPIFPFGLSNSVEYNNIVYGGIAAARFQMGETSFWAGPRLTYRHSDVSLGGSDDEAELGTRVRDAINDMIDPKEFVSLGASLHYDTRNNPVSPTDGINAVLKVDRFDDAWGSAADFNNVSAMVTSFTEFRDAWSLGMLTEYDTTGGDVPFTFAPSVGLRGVQQGRYSGDSALTAEVELRRQFSHAGPASSLAAMERRMSAIRAFTKRKTTSGPGAQVFATASPAKWGLMRGSMWRRALKIRSSTSSLAMRGCDKWTDREMSV